MEAVWENKKAKNAGNQHKKSKFMIKHLHVLMFILTIRSLDGEFSVSRLLKQAKQNNLYCVSIAIRWCLKALRLKEKEKHAPAFIHKRKMLEDGTYPVEITCSDPETPKHLFIYLFMLMMLTINLCKTK